MARHYGPKDWNARKEGMEIASDFFDDLSSVASEVEIGDELWERLGADPHTDQLWNYVFPMMMAVAARAPGEMGFGPGYSMATFCELLMHVFGVSIELNVLPPAGGLSGNGAAVPVGSLQRGESRRTTPCGTVRSYEVVDMGSHVVFDALDLLTPGPEPREGLDHVFVAPGISALKTSHGGFTTVRGFFGDDPVCSITLRPERKISLDVDLRGSFSEEGLAAAVVVLKAAGIEARGSIAVGTLELVVNWRNYFEEIACRRICANPFPCQDEFDAWRQQQVARRESLDAIANSLKPQDRDVEK